MNLTKLSLVLLSSLIVACSFSAPSTQAYTNSSNPESKSVQEPSQNWLQVVNSIFDQLISGFKNMFSGDYDTAVQTPSKKLPTQGPNQLLPGSTATGSASPSASLGEKLTIQQIDASDIKLSQAVITWITNISSTSQIVFSSKPSARYDVTNSSSGAHFSSLDPTLVKYHKVILTGLTPGRLYFYKAISSNSSDSVESQVKILRTP